MNEREWNRLRIPAHIRNIVLQYSKIKGGFLNEKKVEEFYDDPRVAYGIEKIKEELLKMKKKIEKYEKDTGLDKVKL